MSPAIVRTTPLYGRLGPGQSGPDAQPAPSRRTRNAEAFDTARLLLRPRRGEVLEARVLLDERHVDVADRPGAVLEEQHLGDALLLGVGLVVLLAVEGHDGVGVLLDGARLAEVGEHGLAVLAALGGAVELGQGDHRDVELLRE